MTATFSLFMQFSKIADQFEQLLQKKFSNSMLSLESDKMTALWPNSSLDFFSYILDNISQCLTILGNVWLYWTIIVPFDGCQAIFLEGYLILCGVTVTSDWLPG